MFWCQGKKKHNLQLGSSMEENIMGEQSKDLDNLGQVHLLSFFLLDTGEPEKFFMR